MAFCTQCGQQMGPADAFCGHCGAPQGPASPSGRNSDPLSNVPPNVVATLCYVPVAGSLACLYALVGERFRLDRKTRFHGFQGLYLFVAWLLLDWAITPILRLGFLSGLLHVALVVTGLFMMIRTHRNEDVHLPIFGDLAERSLTEQP
jgi:uncharacterized membrane protein